MQAPQRHKCCLQPDVNMNLQIHAIFQFGFLIHMSIFSAKELKTYKNLPNIQFVMFKLMLMLRCKIFDNI